MSTITVKEWAAEYRRVSEWEQQERIARLSQESVEDSVRSYFALCAFLLKLSNEADENPDLSEYRLRHYEALAERWRRLARRSQYAAQP